MGNLVTRIESCQCSRGGPNMSNFIFHTNIEKCIPTTRSYNFFCSKQFSNKLITRLNPVFLKETPFIYNNSNYIEASF